MAEINKGIKHWDKTLLCCSKPALEEGWWIKQEIEKTIQKEQELKKARGENVLTIVPLDLDGFVFDQSCTSPYGSVIKSRLVADFKGWDTDNAKYESELEKLVRALRADEFAREKPPESKL